MRKLFLIIFILFIVNQKLISQSIIHPWCVVDKGGGKLIGSDLILQSSIGQSAVQRMVYIDTGMVMESGYIPGLRNYSGALTTLGLQIAAGWNMVSVPLVVSDYRKISLFPTAISSAYYYDNGYKSKDTLDNLIGYWLKFPSAQSVNITGTGIMSDTINVLEKWNIIGTISYPILISDVTPVPPVVLQSNFFGYESGIGYYPEDTLKPGFAYWLKVSEAGKLAVKSGSVLRSNSTSLLTKTVSEKNKTALEEIAGELEMGKVTFKDADSRERTLYFSNKSLDIDLDAYELPPPPPSEILDVRFSSQRNVEVADETIAENKFPISLNGASYPVKLSWEIPETNIGTYKLEIITINNDKPISRIIDIDGFGDQSLDDIISAKLIITSKNTKELPKEFALYQNYPNPFNPKTKIRYDLPVTSKVSMTLYNILGQKVLTLVDEIQDAGYKTYEFDVNNLASSVYFYKLEVISLSNRQNSYCEVKKMILIK